MSAGPRVANLPAVGRGRGTALPAWMTSGVGSTSVSALDAAAPQLAKEAAEKEEEEDLLADVFDDRDKGAAARLKAEVKTKSAWGGGGKKSGGWAGGGKKKRG